MSALIEYDHETMNCTDSTDLTTLDNGSFGWVTNVFRNERFGYLRVRDLHYMTMRDFVGKFTKPSDNTNEPNKVTKEQLLSWISYYDMSSQFLLEATPLTALLDFNGLKYHGRVLEAIANSDARDWQVMHLKNVTMSEFVKMLLPNYDEGLMDDIYDWIHTHYLSGKFKWK